MISDEAVEAAWDKLHENPVRPIGIDWSELQAALESAAPFIAADAWDRAAASIVDEHGNPIIPTNVTNPYRSQA